MSAAILAATIAAACGSSTGPSGANGTLNVRITDAPFDEAKAVLVTFSEVSVHEADTEEDSWITLAFAGEPAPQTRTCDLKRLEDAAEDLLGTGDLPAGHYTQIRLTVTKVELFFENESGGATACEATAPAGEEATEATVASGQVKLVRQFTIEEGADTTMLIDVDGARSLHETGNGQYRMTPVIGVVSVD